MTGTRFDFALLCAVQLLTNLAQAQPPDTLWVRVLSEAPHSTIARDICEASNGDLFVLAWGNIDSAGQPIVIRYNSQGDTLWSQHYGFAPHFVPEAICLAGDGGFYITGNGDSGGVDLRKISGDGTLEWRRLFVDPGPPPLSTFTPYRISQSNEGGSAILCRRFDPDPTSPRLALLRYNQFGNLLWYRTYTNTNLDYPCGIFQTSDNGYIIGASSDADTVFESQMYLLRVDAQGDSLWSRSLGGYDRERPQAMSKTTDEGVVFCGRFWPHGGNDLDPPDAFAARADSSGSLLWQQTLGGPMFDQFFTVVEASTGAFICAGDNSSDYPVSTFWIAGLTAEGHTEWSEGYFENATAYAIIRTNDGAIAACGATSHPSYGDGLVVKLGFGNGVDRTSIAAPSRFHLHQNFPNPFNESTTLLVTMDRPTRVSLEVVDLEGRIIRRLIDSQIMEGRQKVTLHSLDVASGIYFCRLRSEARMEVVKMIYLR